MPTLRQLTAAQASDIEDQRAAVEELSDGQLWLRQQIDRLDRDDEENHGLATEAGNVAADASMRLDDLTPRVEAIEEIAWTTAAGLSRRVDSFARRLDALPDVTTELRVHASEILRMQHRLGDLPPDAATTLQFLGESLARIEDAQARHAEAQERQTRELKLVGELCLQLFLALERSQTDEQRAEGERQMIADLKSGRMKWPFDWCEPTDDYTDVRRTARAVPPHPTGEPT